jgi:hypothetical protein
MQIGGNILTGLVNTVSILRSGISSGEADLRRQFAHNPLQAKVGF